LNNVTLLILLFRELIETLTSSLMHQFQVVNTQTESNIDKHARLSNMHIRRDILKCLILFSLSKSIFL
jgi:hypothetical protein